MASPSDEDDLKSGGHARRVSTSSEAPFVAPPSTFRWALRIQRAQNVPARLPKAANYSCCVEALEGEGEDEQRESDWEEGGEGSEEEGEQSESEGESDDVEAREEVVLADVEKRCSMPPPSLAIASAVSLRRAVRNAVSCRSERCRSLHASF